MAMKLVAAQKYKFWHISGTTDFIIIGKATQYDNLDYGDYIAVVCMFLRLVWVKQTKVVFIA